MTGNFRRSDESFNHGVVGRLGVQYHFQYHCIPTGLAAARGANEVVFITIW